MTSGGLETTLIEKLAPRFWRLTDHFELFFLQLAQSMIFDEKKQIWTKNRPEKAKVTNP